MAVWEKVATFAAVFISKIPKYRQRPDGTIEKRDYYRLSENWPDAEGKVRKRTVVNLGELPGYTKAGRRELGSLLEEMIQTGSCRMSEDASVYDDAVKFYAHWRDLHPKASSAVAPEGSLERSLESLRRDIVTISLSRVTNHEPRVIGPEVICRSTANRLGLMEFLLSNGFNRQEAELAVMQIVARAIYPHSEYRTAKYLRDNTALAEMFHIPKEKLTKDALYKSALRLWEVHRRMEDWLHGRVTSMFHLEEKILLLDITNTYMEGRMDSSKLCFFGRSKEKRSDYKLVVLAAVVNTEGLIVRTMIYEGNRQDVTTLQEVAGTLSATTSQDARKIVVMDAGFYSADNAGWLADNHFDYITVLPSGCARFTAGSDRVVRHEDCRHREIRLQMGKVEMIEAHYNHPCLYGWGISNEVWGNQEEIKALADFALTLDPVRIMDVCCNKTYEELKDNPSLVLDLPTWNEYTGTWHGNNREELPQRLASIREAIGERPMLITEAGLCEPAFVGGDGTRIDDMLYHVKEWQKTDYICGYIYFCLQDYRTQMGEEGLGKWRIRRHGVTKVNLTPKASYYVLRQLMAPIDITEVLPANSMKSGDALAGQIVVDNSDHDARITLQVKNTIPSYTLRGYTLNYKDGNGQRQTIALPDMQPGMKHTLVLKNINAQYAFEIQRPNGYKVIEY